MAGKDCGPPEAPEQKAHNIHGPKKTKKHGKDDHVLKIMDRMSNMQRRKSRFYPVKEDQKCRSVQQQMSRHNSRVGFEISQELRLDNQQLELRKTNKITFKAAKCNSQFLKKIKQWILVFTGESRFTFNLSSNSSRRRRVHTQTHQRPHQPYYPITAAN